MMADFSKSAATRATTGADPLLAIINEYQFGCDSYDELPNALSEEEQRSAFESLVGKPLTDLESWEAPASTWEGALAALRLAQAELEDAGTEPVALQMVAAAVAFFEDPQKWNSARKAAA